MISQLLCQTSSDSRGEESLRVRLDRRVIGCGVGRREGVLCDRRALCRRCFEGLDEGC
jgi:hypothetical protein